MANYQITTSAIQERVLNWYALTKRSNSQQVVQELVDNFLAAEQDHYLDDQDEQLLQQVDVAIAQSNHTQEDKELLKLKLRRRK